MTRNYRQATNAERKAIQHTFLTAVLSKGRAGTDNAHAFFELPDDVEPRTWGAITGGLQVEGLICRTGEPHTRRSAAHGWRIGFYAVTDVERARKRCERLAATSVKKRTNQLSLLPEYETDPTEQAGSIL